MSQKYDFYDFGCSAGGNIAFLRTVLPDIAGLGIDIDDKKLEQARLQGHAVLNCNILEIPDQKIVSFVTMAHFLEHLPDVSTAYAMIHKGINVSRDFVHIRQPFMDCDGYLLSKDLKLYWSDWTGHRNAMTSLDFYKMLRTSQARRQIHAFGIYGRGPIETSEHEAVIPLNAPKNSLSYESEHGPKSAIDFEVPIYSEVVVDIIVDEDAGDAKRRAILGKLNLKMPMTLLHSSENYESFV